ncbi:hypothetical protein lerEdw1_003376 [Lerista edwardsae]|nr:hypothetical protein lerEdw1_003376 [Lerista edwardsae]
MLVYLQGNVKEPEELVASLQGQSPGTSWVILMAGGGHFAGAVFKGNEVLEHKTFHRYTVRARRGRSQGLQDAKGSMSKSAGASLRRYNEAALLRDIQELLASWAGHLQGAECIFLRANRARFFGSKNGPLQRDDSRIQGIPFSTRRATFHEVQRVHGVLSCLQVYGKDTAVEDLIGTPRKIWRKGVQQDEASPQHQDTTSPSQSEGEQREEKEEQLELVEETLNTLELREFEVAPKWKRKRRKKKPKAVAVGQEVNISSTISSSLKESCTETSGGVEEPEALLGRRCVSTGNLLETQAVPITSVQDTLFTACKTGDLRTLQQLLGMAEGAAEGEECNGITPQQLLNTPLDESGWTLLHVAAAAGRSAVVRLLLEAGADPALRDRQEQPPYCVSADRQTRSEFRRFMGEQPEKYNYVRAQVSGNKVLDAFYIYSCNPQIPGPLTAEMEARQAERRRAQKAQRKQREKEGREAQQLLEQEEDEKRRFALLSDREKRALTAERRLAAQLKDSNTTLTNTRRCWLCGESLLGRIPFHYLDFSFCSTSCLQAHRQKKAVQS